MSMRTRSFATALALSLLVGVNPASATEPVPTPAPSAAICNSAPGGLCFAPSFAKTVGPLADRRACP